MSDVSRFVDSIRFDHEAVWIEGEHLVGEDFSGLPVRRWVVVDSRLEQCRFDGVRGRFSFSGTLEQVCEYVECSFDGAQVQLDGHAVRNARFVGCSFRNVRLSKMNFLNAELIDCVFTGRLSEITFNATVPEWNRAKVGRSSNRYERNDFSGARLAWVAFRGGVNLLDQRLPSEDGYLLVEDAEQVLPAAYAEVLTWPESGEKEEVRITLETCLEEFEHGQRQILFSPYDWVSKDGVRERAFAQLSELLIRLGARNPGALR